MKKENVKEVHNNKKQSFMSGVLTILIAQLVIKILGLIYFSIFSKGIQYENAEFGVRNAE